MTKELKQQFTLKISQANKTQLVVILYEMMLIYIEEARQANKAQNKESFRQGIKRAKGCLHELMASLHFEYPIAGNLMQLYAYADKELTRADIKNSTEELAHVEAIMVKLHAAYETVSGQDTSEPVMANTQTVYAGLTYGRNTLNESLADQGGSRGFRV
ncbi:MAG: flagellar protein FliS [Suilimivivens sp.]